VNKLSKLTRPRLGGSIAWRAYRRRDPTPIHTPREYRPSGEGDSLKEACIPRYCDEVSNHDVHDRRTALAQRVQIITRLRSAGQVRVVASSRAVAGIAVSLLNVCALA